MIKLLMLGPARSVKGGMTSVVDNYFDAGIEKKVDITYIETVNDKNAFSKILKMISGFLKFITCINRCDIVHIHMASRMSTFRKGIYVRIAKKKNKKVILHIHGAEYKIFYEKECTKKQQKYVINTLNLADKIIVLSEEWKEYFEKIIDKDKIIIIYNSILIPKDFKKDLDTQKILFLGRFGERKGIYDLLDVVEKLITDYPKLKLYAGGDGEIEKVQKIVKEKDINDNFEYLGWVNGKEKEKYLKEVSFYVLPSYNEGMPMSLIEGMAYKNVSISTNVGGIPKVINNMNNGIIINPGDKDELYNNMKKLLDNDKLRKKLSNNARITVEEKFNINNNLDKLLNVYKSVLEEVKTK